MAVKLSTFIELLKAALEYSASDIHIREGEPPCFRILGDLIPIKSPPVKKSDIISICHILIEDQSILESIEHLYDIDGGKTFEDVCRIRFNYFKFQEKSGLILRLIKKEIPSFDKLNLSKSLKGIANCRRGLILITGPTGSGKSTTMATIIDEINRNRDGHIVTIEDPVEYLFVQDKCRITQREVGIDTENFNSGLRSALRQDPNVIMIGEMRDKETVEICLKAAETGHLVISTIHTTNAENTIGRIIAMFDSEAQRDARERLSENLYATISQRLVKRVNGEGMIAVQEIMVNSPGVKSCIAGKEEMKNLYTYIREHYNPSASVFSHTFEQHLLYLLKKKLITKKDAIEASSNAGDFAKTLDLE